MKIESYIFLLLMLVFDAFDRIKFKYVSPLNVPMTMQATFLNVERINVGIHLRRNNVGNVLHNE